MAKHHRHKSQQSVADSIQSIYMHRTGCYGRCPIYKIELNNTGMAKYTAIRFTADSGVFEKNIGKKKAAEIFEKIIDSRIDTCKNLYPTRISDLPGLIFTITYTNSTKTINNANFGPPVLRKLTESIDSITGKKLDESWQRVPGTAK